MVRRFRRSIGAPVVQLANNWSIRSYIDSASLVISINDPGAESKLGRCKLFEFYDLTPEQVTGKATYRITDKDLADMDGVVASLEQVEEILDLIRGYLESGDWFGILVLHSPAGVGRASCFAIAAEYIRSGGRSGLWRVVKEHPDVRPNLWVCGLIDYAMRLEGRFVSEIEEFLSTGVVISPPTGFAAGEIIKASWGD